MRIRKFGCVLGLSIMLGAPLGGAAFAFDPDKVFSGNAGAQTILRYGVDALREGRTKEALGAFQHGAGQNHLAAQWKLAQMYSHGQGIDQNHLAAFELYQTIAARYADIPPTRRDVPYVANAVRSLGMYWLTGIEGTPISANPFRAEANFVRAAALYGDLESQYHLGKMYRSDVLGAPHYRQAARWLVLASSKGHAGAEAELGEMLFYGEGVRRNRVKGLVYMSRAVARSAGENLEKFRGMRRAALAEASEKQRNAAAKVLAKLNILPSLAGPTQTFGFAASASE